MFLTPLFLYSISFILGLLLACILDLNYSKSLIIALISVFIYILKRAKYRKFYILILIFIFGVCFWPSLSKKPSNLILGRQKFEAIVCQEPRANWFRQTIILCPLNKEKEMSKIISWWPLYPPFYKGDILELSCDLKKPESLDDFDYPLFLARQKIYRQCSFPILIEKKENNLNNYISKLKRNISNKIKQNLNEPEAGLVEAMILGNRDSLSPKVKKNFQKAGLSHLIAVSGAHISLLSFLFIFLWLRFGLSRSLVVLPLILFLSFYVFLVEARAPAIRALILSSGAIIAWRANRVIHPLSFLTATAAFTLLLKPWSIIDISWQLSFMAMFGIIILLPIWQKLIEKKLKRVDYKISNLLRPILMVFGLSLSVQIFIWPLLVFNFKSLAIVSLISNLLAFFAFSSIMFILPITIFLSFLLAFLSIYIFSPLNFIVKYLIYISSLTSKWDLLYLEVNKISIEFILIYYLLLFIMLNLKTKKQA